MVPILHTVNDLREKTNNLRRQNKTIGFVPTMGYLHEGHLSLITQSKAENDITIVSIFVNPKQFGENEDFATYPRDLKRDMSLINEGVDYLFTPSVDTMYPANSSTVVTVNHFSNGMCGAARPGHFTGVATVVTKLLNIVAPDKAYFGQKDFQQYIIIKKLVEDLNINSTVISCPTIREQDGLAMSSRNIYLDKEQRKQAIIIYKTLLVAKELIRQGESNPKTIINKAEAIIKTMPLAKIDYFEIREINTWDVPTAIEEEPIIIAAAVYFGKTRLIDNIYLHPGL